ncbi:MAG: cyclic nucleotide-binding domain-containing protein [Sinimarinibacterium flocculans]|uniref:Transcriptional regulator n=1 Tax=Sinimarinibacterium flocculans TaxID=985250 RepID=A0A318E3P5_9GAMM|nr:cyclic nucleotide-binding domain-containing protein [Sinimarinibacterium flocculans]MEC9362319.1 cyclic nucleotide-binding domain-containing protein [Pseudomonadota bacterium]PXV65742.1 transcriptional regulator [Sinimarinibacterium flocculans]
MLEAANGPDHLRALQALYAVAVRRQVAARQVVIHEGDVPRSLYLIDRGAATVSLSDWHGEEAVLSLLGPGDFFGEMGMFPSGDGVRSAQVQARVDSTLLEIDYARFVELSREHPVLWLELAGQLAARLRRTNRRLVGVRVLKLSERIWYVLAELAARPDAQRVDGGHCVRITRDELGMLTGCTRETAGKALAELEQDGRIRTQGRSIIVPELPAASGESGMR